MTGITPAVGSSRAHWYLNDLLYRIAVSLQLTPTQHREAARHYEAVAGWLNLADSSLAAYAPLIFPQGSLRIGTTVRPLGRTEYDLDLVCEFLAMQGPCNPLWILDLVERRLRKHGAYGPMVERMNRCIRLNYAGQFHLDILPARPDLAVGGTCLVVPDQRLEDWVPSNPKGYAAWFDERSALRRIMMSEAIEPLPPPKDAEDKSPLQLAVQLFKRWRDVAYAGSDFAPISIVLTTLAGTHYQGQAQPLEALTGIVHRIVEAIPATGRLVVSNPAQPAEDLSQRWDREPAAYTAFVTEMRKLRQSLDRLPTVEGLPKLRDRLADLFGADVATAAVVDQARAIEEARAGDALSIRGAAIGLATTPSTGSTTVRSNTFYG